MLYKNHILIFVGILDSSSTLMYVANIPEATFYSIILAVKAATASVLPLSSTSLRAASSLLIAVALAVAVSTAWTQTDITALLPILSFLISLSLTLLMVNRSGLMPYLRGASLSGAAIAITYLICISSGRINDQFGRHLYFGDAHPNLGGEILLALVIASSFVLRGRTFTIFATLALLCCFELQARTAIISIAASFAATQIVQRRTFLQRRWKSIVIFWLLPAFILALVAIAASNQIAHFILDTVLLANDEYRGSDTGFVGRDDHWLAAVTVFRDNPLFGAGIAYPERLNVLQAHNWFLYILAQFGVFGIPIMVAFCALLIRLAIRAPDAAFMLSPFLFPLIFNDRLFSMNAYPFMMYVLVGSLLSSAESVRRPFWPLDQESRHSESRLFRSRPRASLQRV